MSNAKSSWFKWSMVGVTLGALAAFSIPMHGQAPAVHVGKTQITGLPDDWSHHHVVFSNAGTEQDAIKNGTHEQWLKVVNDPRYVMQQLRRNLPVQGPAAVDANYRARWISEVSGGIKPGLAKPEDFPPLRGGFPSRSPRPIIGRKPINPPSSIHTDWNETLGDTKASTPLAYPAKWSFSTTGNASCANDFVIFPTGQAGASGQASIIAYYNLYTGGCTSGTVPEVGWAYNTSGTISLAPEFSAGGNQVAFIQQPSSGAAQLVLLTFPPPGTAGNGTSVTSPVAPTAETASAYYNSGTGCAAPCSFSTSLNSSVLAEATPTDSWSNPYYDYGTDTLYVGDVNGVLHKFNPVFNGVPAEVVTGGWPTQMKFGATTDAHQLASPVYDPTSGNVFVGSAAITAAATGYFYSVKASNGTINGYSSTQLDTEWGIRDAPLLDPVAAKVYVFTGGSAENTVYQYSTTGFSGPTAPGASKNIGAGSNSGATYQFAGTFDNNYYTSSPSSPSGYLYVCGTNTGAPIYQVQITSNAMGTVVTGPTPQGGTNHGRCSPVTEFYNSAVSEDLLFVGVGEGSGLTGCTSGTDGCVMSYNITTASSFTSSSTPLGQLGVTETADEAPTSGFIVDNAATNLTGGGESQIYFLTVGNAQATACLSGGLTGICAVQASQSAP